MATTNQSIFVLSCFRDPIAFRFRGITKARKHESKADGNLDLRASNIGYKMNHDGQIAESPNLASRFTGCILGLAVGDALGARFEGRSCEHIAREVGAAGELLNHAPSAQLNYTDDTQMAIGVAEALIQFKGIDYKGLCRRFAANFQPHRGYGRGARLVLEAMVEGQDHQWLAENLLPGGSYGNGAAMRVAPVGLMFRHDHDQLLHHARHSALPTHIHPLGIEGAQLIALAVALASTARTIDRHSFIEALSCRCESIEFSGPLRRAGKIDNPRDLALFGNGIEATASVVTAIASFALTPHSYGETVANVIRLGGDTDTMAAMAGAISGAYLGFDAIPKQLLDNLENQDQGRDYLIDLAAKLTVAHAEIA